MRARFTLTFRGIVQGVGFRPFVLRQARALGLCGSVLNTSSGVIIVAEGERASCEAFFERVKTSPPPGAVIFSADMMEEAPRGESEFKILPSMGGAVEAAVSPDLGICADCERELLDPRDRRYMYPFLNCTACGPRFTILYRVPYDRANTTMAGFPMCAPCESEYHDPENRRFHAQPTACRSCGPRLLWVEGAGDADEHSSPLQGLIEQRLTSAGDAGDVGSAYYDAELVARFKRYILLGRLVAVKGLGGYHLACDATNEAAVRRLREAKRRYAKPLAVMMRDISQAEAVCCIDEAERAELLSARKPILLLKLRERCENAQAATAASASAVSAAAVSAAEAGIIAPSVAPGNDRLGVMLPYTPLHVLLTRDMPPLVMTSANVSDAPMLYKAEDEKRILPLADALLTHDRPILRRMDDSVATFIEGKRQLIRRARGFAPTPVTLNAAREHGDILAFGAQLKNTFCLVKDARAYLSGHIGDLDDAETFEFYERELESFLSLFGGKPEALACDMHPDYASTRAAEQWARRLDAKLTAVQHHHAHFASVLAEHDIMQARGFIFDGSGYGADGTIWGGEMLLGGTLNYERAAHLRPIRLIGGDAAVREPWRTALYAAFDALGEERALELFARPEAKLLLAARESKTLAPKSSGMGRLFDAVAALAGLCLVSGYEGQAAVALEQAYDEGAQGAYCFDISKDGLFEWDWRPVIQDVVRDIPLGAGVISARFHRAVIALVDANAARGEAVALSGGVFQNRRLLLGCTRVLEKKGVSVYTNERVPVNDAGICYGQAAVCAAGRR